MDLNRFVVPIAAAALLAVSSALAQNVSWRTPVTVDVPSGSGIRLADTARDEPGSAISVAMVLLEGEGGEDYLYRAVATDPGTGEVLWSVDLGADCATWDATYSLVVPLPGGDSIVAAQAVESQIQGLGSTCIRRLSGTNGSVVWSRTLESANSLLYINDLAPDTEGRLVGGGRKGANAYAIGLDAQTGNTLWEREIPPTAGYYAPRIVASVAGPGDIAVLQLYAVGAGEPGQRLLGVSAGSGTERWSQSRCASGSMAYRPSSSETRFRLLADASFEFVSDCLSGSVRRVELGRINALTGAPVWQRVLQQSGLGRAVIDSGGNLLLDGTLLIDSNEVGIARLDPASGSLQWSLPRPSETNGIPPYVTHVLVATETHVHVLELSVDVSSFVRSAALATYSATTGAFLGRFDVDLGGNGGVFKNFVGMRARSSGELVITALRAQSVNAGASLFETRLNVSTQASLWSQTHSLMAPRAFIPPAADHSIHQMAWSPVSEPGLVIGGSGVNQSGYSYPRAAKVSALDGRLLWRWQPDHGVRGFVSAVLSAGDGHVVVAGSNGWDDPSLLLTKLDGADGHPIWTSSPVESRPALAAALGSGDTILLLLRDDEVQPVNAIRVARYSAANGVRLWSTPVPDGTEGWDGEARVAAGQDGSVYTLSAYGDATTGAFGLQVARFSNDDGTMLWLRRLPGSDNSGTVALVPLANGDVIAADHGIAWRVGGGNGMVLWQRSLVGWTWTMSLDAQGRLYAGGQQNGQGTIWRLDPTNGTVASTTALPVSNALGHSELVSRLGLASDGNILAAAGDGYGGDVLAKLSPTGTLLWRVPMAAPGISTGSSRYPVALLEAPDRNLFVGGLGNDWLATWTVSRVTGSFADGIFATGFD